MIVLLAACAQTPGSVALSSTGDVVTHTLAPLPLPVAAVVDTGGSVIQGAEVTWAVTPSAVARVDGHDLVPVADGEATVQARCGPASTSFQLRVSLPDAIGLVDVPAHLGIGVKTAVRARVTADGEEVPEASITWTSETPDIATVDAEGNVEGLTAGRAHVTAHSGALATSLEAPVLSGDARAALIRILSMGVQADSPPASALFDASADMPEGPSIGGTQAPSVVHLALERPTAAFDGGTKTVQKFSGQIKYCLDVHARREPTFAYAPHFELDVANGHVIKAERTGGDALPEDLTSCLIGKLRRWQFAPEATGRVAFTARVDATLAR